MSQIDVPKPVTMVLKLVVDDQHERLVGWRGNMDPPPPQLRRRAETKTMSPITVEVRRTGSAPLQIDRSDIPWPVKLDVPSPASRRSLVMNFVANCDQSRDCPLS